MDTISSSSMNFTPDFSKLVDDGIWGGLMQPQAPQLTNQLSQLPQQAPLPMAPLPMMAGRRVPQMLAPRAHGYAGVPQSGGPVGSGGSGGGGGGDRGVLEDAARKAGFTGDALRTAVAIGMAESGGNPHSFNGNVRTGDQSYGLFQINMLGNMGPSRRAQYGLSSNDALFDPYQNARVAYAMSGGGKNWGPWSTYKSGAYRRYY